MVPCTPAVIAQSRILGFLIMKPEREILQDGESSGYLLRRCCFDVIDQATIRSSSLKNSSVVLAKVFNYPCFIFIYGFSCTLGDRLFVLPRSCWDIGQYNSNVVNV